MKMKRLSFAILALAAMAAAAQTDHARNTTNAEAVDAVHSFLRFQIAEHKTGDALEVK